VFHDILVAVDGSADADAALAHAIDLAESEQTRLTLLAAVEELPPAAYLTAGEEAGKLSESVHRPGRPSWVNERWSSPRCKTRPAPRASGPHPRSRLLRARLIPVVVLATAGLTLVFAVPRNLSSRLRQFGREFSVRPPVSCGLARLGGAGGL
jgi:hypothetical protein